MSDDLPHGITQADVDQHMDPNRDALGTLARVIVDNTNGDLFWIGELLLSTLERETGFKWEPQAAGMESVAKNLMEELRKVQRLQGQTYSSYEIVGFCGKAADEIERLRTEIRELRAPVWEQPKIVNGISNED